MSFSNPKYNLEQLGLSKGQVVADLGAGSGFYALEAGRMVSQEGVVYAIDIQKDLLERLKKEAQKNKINLQIISGDLEKMGGSRLRDGSVDRVIVSNILFQVEQKEILLKEAMRIAKDGGLILVVDWAGSFGNLGPDSKHVFYKDDCLAMAKSLGFDLIKEIEAGDHHYGLVFRK